jgi:hypothetical protein
MIRSIITLILVIGAFVAGFWLRGYVEVDEDRLKKDTKEIRQRTNETIESSRNVINNIKEKSSDVKDVIGDVLKEKSK